MLSLMEASADLNLEYSANSDTIKLGRCVEEVYDLLVEDSGCQVSRRDWSHDPEAHMPSTVDHRMQHGVCVYAPIPDKGDHSYFLSREISECSRACMANYRVLGPE